MVQYYYDKYTTTIQTLYTDDAPWVKEEWLIGRIFQGKEKTYVFNNVNNTYQLAGERWGDVDIVPGNVCYELEGTTLVKYVATAGGLGSNPNGVDRFTKKTSSNSSYTSYSRGALQRSDIPAEDGTYPANGRHTDGFWYVKKGLVGPLPPGTVINKPYSTSGNGGRKFVSLQDGTLVTCVFDTDKMYYLYKSLDDGITWSGLTNITATALHGGFSMVAHGNDIKLLVAYSNQLRLYRISKTGDVVYTVISSNETSPMGGVSLAIDPTNGHLHAAWASKTTTYYNSLNIRYAKSTDGGATWSAVMQRTAANSNGHNYFNPSIIAKNGKVAITYERNSPSNNSIECDSFNGTSWSQRTIYNGVSYVQSNPSAVVDKNGVIHVAWQGTNSSNTNRNQIKYSKSIDGGTTWETVLNLTNDATYHNMTPTITVDKNNRVCIIFTNTYSPNRLMIASSANSGATWDYVKELAQTASNPSTLYDPYFVGQFGDIPPMIYQDATSVQYIGSFVTNNIPTASLTSPTTNQTLYENDTLNIAGTAHDADPDQSVTAYYQINNEQRKVLATNLSQTQISLSKQLTFKGGKLYDGETAITGDLADGVAHTLKVWAEDSEKASSTINERAFYVVPNRAPLLSVDAVIPSGVIDTDKFTISGNASDQDANANVTVTQRINGGNAIEIYSGTGGAWEFDVSLAQLTVGQNTIIIEVIDNYGAKTSKTIKLNKDEVKTPILQSVARYKIEPPKGNAKGVLLWIQRDMDLEDLKVELSMTLQGEQESYTTLTATNTAPVDSVIMEDEFYFEADEAKNNIILKLSTSRADINIEHKIHLISGVLE